MIQATLDQLLDYPALTRAWEKVWQNGGAAGTDEQNLKQFSHNLQANLWALVTEVESGSYRPRPLLAVTIERAGKKPRKLAIPSVRDRVLQTLVAQHLTPILEAEFEEISFGYRPGRSVDSAVRQVMQLRDRGYLWVVDADISKYFDEIDHQLLLLELSRYIHDRAIIQLIRTWLRSPIQEEDGTLWTPIRGVPQGSPVSPLLANLYLDWFDEQLLRQGKRLIRFADDFLILCKNQQSAEDSLEVTEGLLNSLGLRLNEEKTRITHFDDGFRFLGVRFLRSLVMKSMHPDTTISFYPASPQAPEMSSENKGIKPEAEGINKADPKLQSADQPIARADPMLRTLYVTGYGARLSREGESILIHEKGTLKQRVPVGRINQIMLFGSIEFTTPFINGCMQRDIPISLFSRNGRLNGVIDNLDGGNTEIQRRQFQIADNPQYRLQIATAMVVGKIRNSRIILGRYARTRKLLPFDRALHKLNGTLNSIGNGDDMDKLRGYEGMAAHHVFNAWREVFDKNWGFEGRKRRPPPDPINAMLSFGYTLLFHNTYSLIRARGLNPNVGLLHSERAGHPALASDLMEEFRAPVVDTLVLKLLLNNNLTPDDFTTDPYKGSCQLSDLARKTFIRAFEAKMNTRVIHPGTTQKTDYRRAIDEQISRLIQTLREPSIPYRPFVVR